MGPSGNVLGRWILGLKTEVRTGGDAALDPTDPEDTRESGSGDVSGGDRAISQDFAKSAGVRVFVLEMMGRIVSARVLGRRLAWRAVNEDWRRGIWTVGGEPRGEYVAGGMFSASRVELSDDDMPCSSSDFAALCLPLSLKGDLTMEEASFPIVSERTGPCE